MLRKSLLTKGFGFIVLIIVLCCSSVSSISTTSISYQNTFYVDDDNIDGPWDGTIEYPFHRIQDAIDAASDGDTIFVYSGTYYGLLTVNKTVILNGEEKTSTIIDGEKINDVIHLTGNNTVIKGFTIQYARDGLFSDDAGIDIRGNNNLITDNIIKNNFNFGIYIQTLDSYNVIENNIFDTNHMCLKLLFTSQTVVVNNTFVNNYGGIKLEYTVSVTLNQNSIFDATYPLIFDDVYSCNVSSNYFFNCGGLNLYSSCSNVFFGNHIKRDAKGGDGIFLTDSSDGNLFKNNVIVNHKDGIRLFAGSDGNGFTGNIIRNNTRFGIYFESACNDNTISENTFSNNAQCGIYFANAGYGNSIYHNNFLKNKNHVHNQGDNSWDDGWKGNYWDDYESRYPDARKTLRGTWNMPYDVDDNNVDRYPLIKMYSHAKVTLMNRLWQLFPDGHILKNLVFQTYLQFQKIHDKNTYLPMKPMSVLITFSSY